MNARRWLVLVVALLLVGGAVVVFALNGIVRYAAVEEIQAMTGRTTSIDAVDVSLLRGRVIVHNFRLAERDGTTPFAELPRLDLHLSLVSLLGKHLRIHELVLSDSNVRVVRLPNNELNISDLLGRSESKEKGRDLTIERFRVARGRVTLEDRALAEPRTWASEHMNVYARNLSTVRDDGTAVATSITAGTPLFIDVKNLRLYPIHLRATAKVEGLDLTPARVYLPPNTTFDIDRGRMTTTVTVALDAREGLRADASGSLEDVVLVQAGGRREVLARMPKMTSQLTGFELRDGAMRVERLAADGTMSVRDPSARTLRPSALRASVSDFTWPATTAGRVDVRASIPGGGHLALAGTVRPPPAATQLALRVTDVNLASWAQFVPVGARVTGMAAADLRMNEPFAAGIPARVQGAVSVRDLAVADARQMLVRAQRIEASGLEVEWPTRVGVKRIVVTGPRAIVERDRDGRLPLLDLLQGAQRTPSSEIGGVRDAPPKLPMMRSVRVDVGEIVVRDGAVAWRDASVKPEARLDVTAVDASVGGIGWPLKGPLTTRASLRPPGGGELRVAGKVGIEPLSADLRVTANHADLASYQSYLPTTARVSGAADADLAVVVPSFAERRATARGAVSLSALDVRDGQRTVVRAERATATEVDVAWPERVAVGRLALARPWILVERDDQGGMPLRALLPQAGSSQAGSASAGAQPAPEATRITIARVTAEDGGMRVVDRAITPAFAVDVDAARLRLDGLSSTSGPPARLDMTARVGGTAELVLRGTIDVLEGPLRLDLDGDIREFAVPRANSYLVNQVGWKSRDGRLSAKLRAKVNGDALSAKSDIRISRLQLVKAGPDDQAQARIGLPLGTITSLMKDKRGDITVSFPVGGKLSDPRFDFRETMWTAIRTVAINAITLPVSWIGRVQFSADSLIQKIHVDPIPFEPGTADLTPDGKARITKLVAFLEQLPDVRMALTPVVSSRDIVAIKRRIVETRVARDARAPA